MSVTGFCPPLTCLCLFAADITLAPALDDNARKWATTKTLENAHKISISRTRLRTTNSQPESGVKILRIHIIPVSHVVLLGPSFVSQNLPLISMSSPMLLMIAYKGELSLGCAIFNTKWVLEKVEKVVSKGESKLQLSSWYLRSSSPSQLWIIAGVSAIVGSKRNASQRCTWSPYMLLVLEIHQMSLRINLSEQKNRSRLREWVREELSCSVSLFTSRPGFWLSYWQFSVSAASTNFVQSHLDIRTNNGDISSERTDGCKEITKQDENAVQLDQKPDQWPAQKN